MPCGINALTASLIFFPFFIMVFMLDYLEMAGTATDLNLQYISSNLSCNVL